MEFLALFREYGPWVLLVAFLVWQSWEREKRMSKRLDAQWEELAKLQRRGDDVLRELIAALRARPCLRDQHLNATPVNLPKVGGDDTPPGQHRAVGSAALLLACLFLLVGCDAPPAPERTASPEAPITHLDPAAQQLTDLRARLAAAELAQAKAATENRIIDRLSAEKDILQIRTQIAEAQASGLLREAAELGKQTKAKDTEIAQERIQAKQLWLYWFSGIMGLVAVIGIGVGFGWPLLRKGAWTIAACAGSIAAIALVSAAILPWLWWIGGALVLGFVGWILYHWNRDHHGLVQVVTAVEGLKPVEKAAREIFKGELSKVIDSPIARRITAIKTRYGIGPQA